MTELRKQDFFIWAAESLCVFCVWRTLPRFKRLKEFGLII